MEWYVKIGNSYLNQFFLSQENIGTDFIKGFSLIVEKTFALKIKEEQKEDIIEKIQLIIPEIVIEFEEVNL